jgi:hypothetical protein
MAQNNDSPGKRLKREEAKNISFGFMRPPQRAIAEASTTSVYQPTSEIAESRMYLQKNPNDLKNLVVADVANVIGLDVRNMNPEQYKRVATVIEELNKKHGGPSVIKNKGRAFYEPFSNSLNIYPTITDKRLPAEYRNRPDEYFQELAHAAQYKNNPIKSTLRGTKGNLLHEDSDAINKGRYAIPGELEYEAHQEIAPRLWDEFKTLYKQKYKENIPPQYENKYEKSQLIANTPQIEGGTLKFLGRMMPEIEIVHPVKRP